MTRATSTVVDVTLFLLLVGAAAAVTVGGASVDLPATENPPAESATILGTTTATIEYELNVSEPAPSWIANASTRRHRTAHGTVAELLGEAAMSAVRSEGTRLSTAGVNFERNVRKTTRQRLQRRGKQTSVRVAWEPYQNASYDSRLDIGSRPSATANVRAATLTVSSGMDSATGEAASAATSEGYEGVAIVVAQTIVDGLFPPDSSELALHGDYPATTLTSARYQRVASLTGTTVSVRDQPTEALNRRITVALTDVIESELRAEFRSPVAAAQSVETETVRITVRTWSA